MVGFGIVEGSFEEFIPMISQEMFANEIATKKRINK